MFSRDGNGRSDLLRVTREGLEGRARTSAAHARDEVERRPLGFRAPDADGRRERSGRHLSFLPIGACSSARVAGLPISSVDTSPPGSRQILVGRNPWFIDGRFP